jgi:hypothetical protein
MIPRGLGKKLEFLLLGHAPNPLHGEILNVDNKDSNISEITAQELTFKGTCLTKRNKNDGIEVTSEESIYLFTLYIKKHNTTKIT